MYDKIALKKLNKKEQTTIIYKLAEELGEAIIISPYEDMRINQIIAMEKTLVEKKSAPIKETVAIIAAPLPTMFDAEKIIIKPVEPVIIENPKVVEAKSETCPSCGAGILILESSGNSGYSFRCSNSGCGKGITKRF